MDSRGRKPKDRESRDVQHHFRGLDFRWGEPGVRRYIPILEAFANKGAHCTKCGLSASWLLRKVMERREERRPNELAPTEQNKFAAAWRKFVRSWECKIDSQVELVNAAEIPKPVSEEFILTDATGKNTVKIEILADGTIRSVSGKIDAKNHQSLEGFFEMLRRLTGGKTTTNRLDAYGKVQQLQHTSPALLDTIRKAYAPNASRADLMRLRYALKGAGVAAPVIAFILDEPVPANQGTQGDEPRLDKYGHEVPKKDSEKGTFLTVDGGGRFEVIRQREAQDRFRKQPQRAATGEASNDPEDEQADPLEAQVFNLGESEADTRRRARELWSWDNVENLLKGEKTDLRDWTAVELHKITKSGRRLNKSLTPEQRKQRDGGDEWTSLNLVAVRPGTDSPPAAEVIKREPFAARELELVERKHGERSYVFALADSDAPDGTPRYRIVKGVRARGWKRSTQTVTPSAIRLVKGKQVPLEPILLLPEENTVLTYHPERIFEVLFEKLTYAETMAQLGVDGLTHGDLFGAKRVPATGALLQYPPKGFCPECGDEHPQGEVFDITRNMPRAPGHTGVAPKTEKSLGGTRHIPVTLGVFTTPKRRLPNRDSHLVPVTPVIVTRITSPAPKPAGVFSSEPQRRRTGSQSDLRAMQLKTPSLDRELSHRHMTLEVADDARQERAEQRDRTAGDEPKKKNASVDAMPRDAKPQGTGRRLLGTVEVRDCNHVTDESGNRRCIEVPDPDFGFVGYPKTVSEADRLRALWLLRMAVQP